jgi:hypothetical protein
VTTAVPRLGADVLNDLDRRLAPADQLTPDVLAKLEREPVEDLRVDFEDGYGPRPPEREDADALGAATALADVLDPLAGLVLGPERYARHVLVDGHHVVRDGRLLGADMDTLRRDLARRLWPEDAR